MIDPDTAAILGNQIVAIIAALGALLGVIANLIVTVRTKRVAEEVRTEVNGKNSVLTARNDQLINTITESGNMVPPKPSTVGGVEQ